MFHINIKTKIIKSPNLISIRLEPKLPNDNRQIFNAFPYTNAGPHH